jgi:AraC-like DNA-binding protein
VPALLRYLAARGHDPSVLVERFALPADVAEHDTLDIVPATINDLLEAAAELLAEPFLALRLPSELPFRRYDVVELALRSSSTLRDGLLTTARHAAAIHPQLELALVEDSGAASWVQRTPGHPRGIGRHAHEYGLAYVLLNARIGLADALPLTRVWFTHPRPRALEPLHRMFGTEELVFGAPDSGFAFARSSLDAPLHGDPRLLATVEALAAASPPPPRTSSLLAPRVAAYLRDHLSDSAAGAAAALHMSARTLQRRLAAEGTTFSGVVDDTREALARELLADRSLPLAEIAYRVGFADLATFSRAFKRWTGKPPGLFRRS